MLISRRSLITGGSAMLLGHNADAARLLGSFGAWQQIAGFSQYATNTSITNSSNFTQVQSMKGFYLNRNFTKLRITIGNVLLNTTLPNVTIKIGVYDPASSKFYQGTVAGSPSVTLADSQYATFDVPLTVLAGAAANYAGKMIYVIKYAVYATAPAVIPASLWVVSDADANQWGNSLTDQTLGPIFSGRPIIYDAIPIVGISGFVTTKSVVVGVLGDSIGAEWGKDSAKFPYYAYIPLGLNQAGIPFVVCGQSGLSISAFMTSFTLQQRQLYYSIYAAANCTHIFCELVTNDIFGFTGAQVIAYMNQLKAELQVYVNPAIKVIPITCQPRTDATNTTFPAGQPNTFTNRAGYNALIVSGNGLGDGYFDVASLLQNASTPNLWRTDLNKATIAVNTGGAGYTNGDLLFLPSGMIIQVAASGGVISGLTATINPGGFVSAATPQGPSNGHINTKNVNNVQIGGPLVGTGALFDLTNVATNLDTVDGVHPGQSYHAYAAFDPTNGLGVKAASIFV